MAGAMLMAFTVWSCRDEHLMGSGQGKMLLEASIEQDVNVVSRALTAEEQNEMCNSALIWISDPAKGLLYRYNGLSSFPAEGLPLSTGHYAVEAWVGDSVPASWDKKRYRGYQGFNIERGQIANVELSCPIRNTLVSVNYDAEVAEVLSDIKLTVSLNDGITDDSHSLTFEGLTTDKGYYMTNSRTKGFKWVLEGTEANGNAFRKEGEYKDPNVEKEPYLAQTTEYVFNIHYGIGDEPQIGGGYLTIEIDPTPVKTENKDILIAMPPEIKGSGFDISAIQVGEPGVNERHAVNIIASSDLKSVNIDGSLLTAVGLLDYDLRNMDESHIGTLESKGITFQTFKGIEGSDDITNMRIIMEETLFNALPEGDYEMNISATDAEGQTSTAVFAISINLAPIMLNPVADDAVSYTSATLTATVKDPSTSARLGFEVRAAGTSEWLPVEGTLSGNLLSGTAEGLVNGTAYEYRAVADDFTTKAMTFMTKAYPQLPNAGFEDWSKPGKPWLVYTGDESNMFWDSGNHGSTTLSADASITTPDSEIKHGGQYSIKLKSAFVGVSIFGKLAAGNVFIGDYLDTDGTDGVLGWGRKFDFPARPRALKGWIRYIPTQITDAASDQSFKTKDDMDEGIVYIALLTDEDDPRESARGDKAKNGWPVVIRTKKNGRQLFDQNAPNVVAYGEAVFTEATPGTGMVEFTIDLTDIHGSLTPSKILVVASASRYGDYFTGGRGSTMWLDDLELVY